MAFLNNKKNEFEATGDYKKPFNNDGNYVVIRATEKSYRLSNEFYLTLSEWEKVKNEIEIAIENQKITAESGINN